MQRAGGQHGSEAQAFLNEENACQRSKWGCGRVKRLTWVSDGHLVGQLANQLHQANNLAAMVREELEMHQIRYAVRRYGLYATARQKNSSRWRHEPPPPPTTTHPPNQGLNIKSKEILRPSNEKTQIESRVACSDNCILWHGFGLKQTC